MHSIYKNPFLTYLSRKIFCYDFVELQEIVHVLKIIYQEIIILLYIFVFFHLR